MTTRKAAVIERALLSKGFQKRENDHAFFVYHQKSDSKKTAIFTKISHGARDINDSLLSKMAKQVGLSNGDFLDLVDCPLTRDAYDAKVVTPTPNTAVDRPETEQ